MKKTLLLILSLFSLIACSNNSSREVAVAIEECAEMEPNRTEENTDQLPSERKLIAQGEIDIDVKKKDADSIFSNINKLVSHYKGYKSKEEQTSYRQTIVANIPSGSFYEFTDAIGKVGGTMTLKDITVKDKTDEYYDVKGRIQSKEVAMQQYHELMKKATKMSDIIEPQNSINTLQEQIDRLNGNRAQIEKKSAFSEVTIVLHITDTDSPKANEQSFGSEIIEALSNGLSLIKYLILGLLHIWPLLIIAGGVLYYLKRKKNKTK